MAKKKIIPTERTHSVALTGAVASSRPAPKAKPAGPPPDPLAFRPAAPVPHIDAPLRRPPQFAHADAEAAHPSDAPGTVAPSQPAQAFADEGQALPLPAAAERVQARLSELRAANAALERKLDRLSPPLPRSRD